MIGANYDSTTGSIRVELADCTLPVEIHAGHEGRSVVLYLTHNEAIQLMTKLAHAIRRAEPAFSRQRNQAHAQPVHA